MAVRTWKPEHYFYEQYWYSVHASVHELLEELPYFLREGYSEVHARFALEIWTLFLRAVWAVFMAARRFDGFFFGSFWSFFALLRVGPGVEIQFSGALDGEGFFAIEGSHAN